MSSNGLTEKTCEVIEEVLHKSQLKNLSLGCNRLTDSGANHLSRALLHVDCPLLSLEIASCGIGDIGALAIANSLKSNKTLVSLNFGFLKSTNDLNEIPNLIGSKGAIHISNALALNTTLRSLDLVHTGIQQMGVAAIANVLSSSNNTLLYLPIEQFGIPHNELSREIIRTSLKRNRDTTSPELLEVIDGILNPEHLKEIKSVYRVE